MNDILWTAATAPEATGGKVVGDWRANAVVIDSRAITGGELFLALKGERFDGHQFVAQSLVSGAAAAVVEHPVPGVAEDKLLIVEDTQKALEDLGAYARKHARGKVVGVTGSVGKTSAKEMLRLALSAHGETFASYGNFNNHIGTPLNLANLAPYMQFAVFEMGMNHAGEIAALAKQVRPDVAVITNVEAVHLEFFKSVDEIARAKAEIFEGMEAGAYAVLNADNPYFDALKELAEERALHVISFGRAESATVCLTKVEVNAEGTKGVVSVNRQNASIAFPAIGEHFALAATMALAVAYALKLDIQTTARALSAFTEPKGRGAIRPIFMNGGTILLMDDSYNASPASMKAAFAKAGALKKSDPTIKRLVAALGDMRELGETAASLHGSLALPLLQNGFDAVFAAGELMQHLYDALPATLRAGYADSAADLLPLLQEGLQPGDLVLIKGSHGSKMYELAENICMQDSVNPRNVNAL